MTADPRAAYLNSLQPEGSAENPVDRLVGRWSVLFARLENPPRQLLTGLIFLRDMGAAFEPGDDMGVKLVAGSCPPEVYEAIREHILRPHGKVLRPALEGITWAD
jgi:hypothetical protein